MPRINIRPDIIELGEAKQVALTRSSSSPNTYHLTVELEVPVIHKGFGLMERTIICSCRGFVNHKKCFHVEHLTGNAAAREQAAAQPVFCPKCGTTLAEIDCDNCGWPSDEEE